MPEGDHNGNRWRLPAAIGILALWAMWVMRRFYHEHPLRFEHLRRLVERFQPPPPPTDLLKIASAGKHLLLACLFVAVGILVGRRILALAGVRRADGGKGERCEIVIELMLALGLGWGLLMYLAFFLGVIGGLYTAVMWGLLLVLPLICRGEFFPLFRDLRALTRRGESKKVGPLALIGAAWAAIMLALILIMALAPSITHDAMVYHLNLPRNYILAHRIVAIPYDLFSNTFFNLEMLYMSALLVDDFILANLLHYALGLGVLALLYAFARSSLGAATAAIATLMLFFNPVVLNELPIAYIDVGMTFYFMLAMYCMWRWKTDGEGRWFALLCVFAGIFAGMKYTSIYGLVTIFLLIAAVEHFSEKRQAARAVKRLAIFGGTVTIFVLPYLIKNYVITGNPVYPVAYNVFGGHWLVDGQVARMLAYVDSHGMGHDWRHMLALPWNITIYGKAGFDRFDATITPLWLILFPALLITRPNPPVVRWSALACIVYFLSWAAYTHITRYMMPMFPLLSLACAHAVVALETETGRLSERLAAWYRWCAILLCGFVWFSFSYFYPSLIPADFGPVVWGEQTRDEFLAKKVLNYGAFKYINESLPADARVMFFWDNRGYFCERSKIGDSVIEAPSMIELAHEAGSAKAFRKKLGKMGITHIMFNRLFLTRFPTHTVSKKDERRHDADLRILEKFLKGYCEPLFEADWATVYALRE